MEQNCFGLILFCPKLTKCIFFNWMSERYPLLRDAKITFFIRFYKVTDGNQTFFKWVVRGLYGCYNAVDG